MGKYHAKSNNCRHYVKKVFNILIQKPEFEEENKISFQENMHAIEEEDEEIVENATNAAAGAGVLLGTVAIIGRTLTQT